MPKGGLEPPRACAHWLLKPARLPVPPLRRVRGTANIDGGITSSQLLARPLPPRFLSCPGPVDKVSIARNPRARHDYHLLETWEAGLVLTGTEVKSLRAGKASLGEAYAHARNGEVWLEGLSISAYLPGSYNNPPPARSRKLLLHTQEIRKLIGGTSRKGLTIVPLELYFKDGIAKVAIALAKAKKQHDKREELKRRVAERELARGMKGKRT